ncbi:hypothetical protein HDU88_001600 [Geranomyces variabilis]|nr:hypothetical protein HDU88_001600 [Geranomyces variabilis]
MDVKPAGFSSNLAITEPGFAKNDEEKTAAKPRVITAATMPMRQLSLLLLGLFFATFLYALEQTIVSTAAPQIASDLNAVASMTWIGTSYLLTTTALQPMYGKLSDIFGRRVMMLSCITVFVLGNLVCALAPTMRLLIIGRVISGVGGAGLQSLTLIIMAVVMGPVAAALVAYSLKLPTPEGSWSSKLKRIDFWGMILLATSLTCLLLALSWGGNEAPWASAQVIVTLACGVIALIAFVYVEARVAAEPFIPMRLLTKWEFRNFPIMVVARTFLFFQQFGVYFYMPIYLQLIREESATKSGISLLPFLVPASMACILANLISVRWGLVRPTMLTVFAVAAVGQGLLSTLGVDSSESAQLLFLLISGLGVGLGIDITVLAAQAGMSGKDVAIVTSVVNTTSAFGGTLAISVIGSVISNVFASHVSAQSSTLSISLNQITPQLRSQLSPQDAEIVVNSFIVAINRGFQVLTGLCVFSFVLCLLMKRIKLKKEVENDAEFEEE